MIPAMSLRDEIRNSNRPIVLIAFGGWSDAANTATNAMHYLYEHYATELVAELDADDFYDYQVNRPIRFMQGDGSPALEWPQPVLRRIVLSGGASNHFAGLEREIFTLQAPEPSFKWRTFCTEIIPKLQELQPVAVILLGAMVGQTPHTRPLPTLITSANPDLAARYNVELPSHQGEIGITSVFATCAAKAGLPIFTTWTTIPNYLSDDYKPGISALLELIVHFTGLGFGLELLHQEVAFLNQAYSRSVAEDFQIQSYVNELEAIYDEQLDPDRLADEFQQFLRQQEPPY